MTVVVLGFDGDISVTCQRVREGESEKARERYILMDICTVWGERRGCFFFPRYSGS